MVRNGKNQKEYLKKKKKKYQFWNGEEKAAIVKASL